MDQRSTNNNGLVTSCVISSYNGEKNYVCRTKYHSSRIEKFMDDFGSPVSPNHIQDDNDDDKPNTNKPKEEAKDHSYIPNRLLACPTNKSRGNSNHCNSNISNNVENILTLNLEQLVNFARAVASLMTKIPVPISTRPARIGKMFRTHHITCIRSFVLLSVFAFVVVVVVANPIEITLSPLQMPRSLSLSQIMPIVALPSLHDSFHFVQLLNNNEDNHRITELLNNITNRTKNNTHTSTSITESQRGISVGLGLSAAVTTSERAISTLHQSFQWYGRHKGNHGHFEDINNITILQPQLFLTQIATLQPSNQNVMKIMKNDHHTNLLSLRTKDLKYINWTEKLESWNCKTRECFSFRTSAEINKTINKKHNQKNDKILGLNVIPSNHYPPFMLGVIALLFHVIGTVFLYEIVAWCIIPERRLWSSFPPLSFIQTPLLHFLTFIRHLFPITCSAHAISTTSPDITSSSSSSLLYLRIESETFDGSITTGDDLDDFFRSIVLKLSLIAGSILGSDVSRGFDNWSMSKFIFYFSTWNVFQFFCRALLSLCQMRRQLPKERQQNYKIVYPLVTIAIFISIIFTWVVWVYYSILLSSDNTDRNNMNFISILIIFDSASTTIEIIREVLHYRHHYVHQLRVSKIKNMAMTNSNNLVDYSDSISSTNAQLQKYLRRELLEQFQLNYTETLESNLYYLCVASNVMKLSQFVYIWRWASLYQGGKVHLPLIDMAFLVQIHSVLSTIAISLRKRQNEYKTMHRQFKDASVMDVWRASQTNDVCCICLTDITLSNSDNDDNDDIDDIDNIDEDDDIEDDDKIFEIDDIDNNNENDIDSNVSETISTPTSSVNNKSRHVTSIDESHIAYPSVIDIQTTIVHTVKSQHPSELLSKRSSSGGTLQKRRCCSHVKKLPCGHLLHTPCLDELIQRSSNAISTLSSSASNKKEKLRCPLCRFPLNIPNTQIFKHQQQQ